MRHAGGDPAPVHAPPRGGRLSDLVERLDAGAGDRIERLVGNHHRRRLRRLGWAHLLDARGAGWLRDGLPVRDGNAVDVLVDGATALPEIAAAIERARSFVHVAGWHVAPGFGLRRDGDAVLTVRDALAAAAERMDVRVLVWKGAPARIFHPTRREVARTMRQLAEGTRIRVGRDGRERPMHCHHEKLVIVDGEVAFVGGIDLTDLAGDRYDRPGHPRHTGLGWHDMALRIRGPLVADVAAHFAMRWTATTGEALPPPRPAAPVRDGISAQLVRTVPERLYDAAPRGDFGNLAVHLGAVRAARRIVHLESQFLWSPELVTVLRDLLERPPRDDFRVVVILPAHPNNGGDDTKGQLGVLHDADAGRGRLLACTVSALGDGGAGQVYVHAKCAIVDDRWMCIGSANLNSHSFYNDTEVGVVVNDATLARSTRERLWAEHTAGAAAPGGDPTHVADTVLRAIAQEQLRRQRAGLPRTNPLIELPVASRRIERLTGPLDGLFVDG